MDRVSEAVEPAENILSWATECLVAVQDFGGYRGLGATQDVEVGQVLMKVPLTKTLSPGRAREALGESANGLGDQDALILYLLTERSRGSESSLAPYIACLPSEEELDVPLVWSAQELEFLEGQAKTRAEALKEAVEKAYATFSAARDASGTASSLQVDLVSYSWGRAILNSRQMEIKDHGIMIVPGICLFNHNPHIRGTRCIFVEDDCIVMRATTSYRAKSEVFITYGDYSNSHLLAGYGIAMDNNPSDSVELFLDLGSLQSEQQEAALLVATEAEECNVDGAQVRCELGASQVLPLSLVQLAQASVGGSEREGLAALLVQFNSLLENYPTDIDDDVNVLQDGLKDACLTWRARCAILSRLGEQRLILRSVKAVIDRLVELLAASKLPQENLNQQKSSVISMYSKFAKLTPRPQMQAQWVVFATAAFLALYGRLGHDCASCLLASGMQCPSAPLREFTERMAFWGSYLAAQFVVTGSIAREDATTMLMESTDLRNKLGWSIPTPQAISMIQALPAPVKVLGGEASSDSWQRALKAAGVQLSEGQEVGASHVVVWPDPGGEGVFGLEVVERTSGVLVCIGEWTGSTLGLMPDPEVRVGGQAWSRSAQSAVNARFPHGPLSSMYLPSWPLACDRLAVYDDRAPCSK